MSFLARFAFFDSVTIMAVIFAPKKLRQPGAANIMATGMWFLLAGLIFLP